MTTTPSSKRKKRAALLLVLLVMVALLPYLSANYILGLALTQIFATGTGCSVQLRSPEVSLFPLRASIEDVVIRAPQERVEEGFFADRVSLELVGSELWNKRVVMTNFRIEGARAISQSDESAFLRTLTFLLQDDDEEGEGDPNNTDAPPGEWDFFITDLTVNGRSGVPPSALPSLRMMQSGFVFDWTDVVFRLVRSPIGTPPIFATTASSTDFFVERGGVRRALRELLLDGEIRPGVVEFKEGSVKVADTEERIFGKGEIRTRGVGDYRIDVRSDAHAPALAALLPEGKEVFEESDAVMRLSGTVSGELLQPAFSGEARFDFSRGYGVTSQCTLRSLEGAFRFDEERVTFSRLRAAELGLESSGEVRLGERFPVKFVAKILGESTPLLRCLVPGNLKETDTHLSLSGSLFPLALRGEFSSKGSFPREIRSDFQGALEYSEKVLRVDLSQLERSPSAERRVLEAKAEYLFGEKKLDVSQLKVNQYSLQALLNVGELFLPLEQFHHVVSPTSALSGEAKLVASFEEFSGSGSGSVQFTDLVLGGVPVSLARSDFVASEEGLQLTKLSLQSEGGEVRGSAQMGVNREVRGEFEGSAIELRSLAPHLPFEATTADLSAKLSGDVERPRVEAEGLLKNGAEVVARAKLLGGTEKGTLEGALLGEGLLFRAEWGEEKVRLRSEARGLELHRLTAFQNRFGDTTGVLDGEFDYTASRNNVWRGEGSVNFEAVEVLGPTLKISQPRPLRWALSAGRISFGESVLLVNDREVLIRGGLSQDTGWNASFRGEWPLQSFLPPMRSIEQISGELEGDLTVIGPFENPEISGPIEVKDASLSLKAGQTIVGVSDVSISALFDGKNLDIQRITAQAGEGEVKGRGVIRSVVDPLLRSGEVRLAVQSFTFEPTEKFVVTLGGEVFAALRPGQPLLLGGEVRIVEALYENRITLPMIIRSVTRTVTGLDARERYGERSEDRQLTGVQGAALDFKVRAANTVLVDTDVVKASLSTDLKVSGTTAKPVLNGSLSADEGVFGLGSRQFSVVSGNLLFSERDPRIDPRVDIVGETDVQGGELDAQRIRLVVSGRLSQPKLSLSSDRGLREQEILAVLGAGPGEATEVSLLQSKKASRGTFERTLAGLTGLSNIEVSYGLSATTGTFVPKVSASRPVVGKVTAQLKSELAKDQTSTVTVEYPISQGFDLVTGWRNAPTVANPRSTTGSFDFGFRYQTTYPGLRIIPPDLLKQREEQ